MAPSAIPFDCAHRAASVQLAEYIAATYREPLIELTTAGLAQHGGAIGGQAIVVCELCGATFQLVTGLDIDIIHGPEMAIA